MEAMADTDITERDLLMLNPKLMLSLDMVTVTAVDTAMVATDMEAMADTDVTERDPLMLNLRLMLPLLPMLSPDMVMVTAMEDTVDTDITERDLLSPDMDMAVMVDTVDTDMAVGTDMDTVTDIMVEF